MSSAVMLLTLLCNRSFGGEVVKTERKSESWIIVMWMKEEGKAITLILKRLFGLRRTWMLLEVVGK